MNLKYLIKFTLFAKNYCSRSRKDGDKRTSFAIIKDMLGVYRRYNVDATQYLFYKLGVLPEQERTDVLRKIANKESFMKAYDENWSFLVKYSGFEWQRSRKKRKQRKDAYIKHYNMGKHCKVQYGVKFIAEHFHIGHLKIEDYVLFARDVDIDITGDLTICEGARIAENVKILTHTHTYFNGEDTHSLDLTPLIIHDHVSFGARVMVLPGVEEIGRGAVLSSGAIIRKRVPPYAVVSGNPSRVVGFRFTPNQILEYEKSMYSPENRLPEELLVQNYKKYYLDNLKEIKSFLM